MAVQRDRDYDIQFLCDQCDEVEDTYTSNFGEARQEIIDQGWSCTKDADGEWTHLCGACKSEVNFKKAFS